MNTNIINNKVKRNKWAGRLKVMIGTLIIVAILFFLISIFSTQERVYSLNAFLSSAYWYFLLFRLVIYGGMIGMCVKMKRKIKPTPYYRSFIKVCAMCLAFVFFNEVMLYIKLMG
ncbi:hypothetical protein RHO12_01825 [Orbus sturtevantii]|uniref:hypothetical protein n=1 Tax=Orbus sturtevantii TaxID=3074109 RepID=UPI00370D55BA